jgi:dethiobiotin synthetase
MAADGDAVALAEVLHPEHVVLVADAGLGTINSVRLSAPALDRWPLTVILNRYDPADELHRRNWAWLAERHGFEVVAHPGDLIAPIVGWPS